jgi:hypothetical protein
MGQFMRGDCQARHQLEQPADQCAMDVQEAKAGGKRCAADDA